jgi:hypothetical protein
MLNGPKRIGSQAIEPELRNGKRVALRKGLWA